jgi:hypothetical protein
MKILQKPWEVVGQVENWGDESDGRGEGADQQELLLLEDGGEA